jgi:hypothetical protein
MNAPFPPLPGVGQMCNGWCWNGTAWVPAQTIYPPCPPPTMPCPPPPCPPPAGGYPPPSCDSWVSAMQTCWNSSEAFEDFITQVITDIFQDNPGIIPPATPAGPIVGVTDGSDAAPGEVGEFITMQINGTVASAGGIQTFPAMTLQPGDWNCQAALDIILEPPYTMQAFQQLWFRLALNGIPICVGDMGGVWTGPDQGFVGGVWPTTIGRVSSATPSALVAQVEFWGQSTELADFTITASARRVR